MAERDKREREGVTGFLSGVSDLLGKLERLAESGGELYTSGGLPEGARKGAARGVYGFSVKVGGLGDKGYRVERFGNVRRDEATGESVVEDYREPLLDVFDEEDRLLIVAEMPGIEPEDVRLELGERKLRLSAERAGRKYKKTVEVPAGLASEQLSVAGRNGIVEISAPKQRPSDASDATEG